MLLLQGAFSKEWRSTSHPEIPFSLGGARETKTKPSRNDTGKEGSNIDRVQACGNGAANVLFHKLKCH